MDTMILITFPIMWLAILAGLYFFVTKGKTKVDSKLLSLYVAFLAMLGPIGEVFVGTVYEVIFGQPLWQYRLFPIHNGYTSLYAPVIWGVAGAYVYIFHEVIQVFTKTTSSWKIAGVHMTETIIVEALLNVSFFVLTGAYIFYYTPGELLHFTSIQTLPFYFGLGLVIHSTIKRMEHSRRFFAAMCAGIMTVTVYLI